MCGWTGIGGFRTTLRASFGGAESNCRHHDFQSCALPTELPWQGLDSIQRDRGLGRGSRSGGCSEVAPPPPRGGAIWEGELPKAEGESVRPL